VTYTVIEPGDTEPTSLEYATHILLGLREHDAPADYIAYVKRRIIASNAALASAIENF